MLFLESECTYNFSDNLQASPFPELFYLVSFATQVEKNKVFFYC